MEDDNGLELSLGLSCGGSAGKAKGKDAGSLDNQMDEDDRGSKVVDDFKSFLNAFGHKPERSANAQKTDATKPQENFFSNLSKATSDADASMNRFSVANPSRPSELDEETRSEAGIKRKSIFTELTSQKKRETEVRDNFHEKMRTSHLSINTEEGSTAENEDVAESEVGSYCDDGSKRLIGALGSLEVQKDICSSLSPDPLGPNVLTGTDGSKIGNINYSVPFSVQQSNAMNIPYTLQVEDSKSLAVPSDVTGHQNPSMAKPIPSSTGDRSGTQSVGVGSIPMLFGYSTVQLPMLDKDGSRISVSHSQPFHIPYPGRGPQNHSMQANAFNPSDLAAYEPRTTEQTKGEEKQLTAEEGSSNQTEDAKGSSTNLKAKDVADGLSFDFSVIKPGIAADLKFGGSGSYPNLPWVSTTGSGPHGRTISGVTYRYSANQIRIVCACHGSHMSPEEFVRHASEEYAGAGLNTIPGTNPAASAHG